MRKQKPLKFQALIRLPLRAFSRLMPQACERSCGRQRGATSGCRHIRRSRNDARAARDAGAPIAWPRLRVQKEGSTRILAVTANTPAPRHPARFRLFGLLRTIPGGRTSTALEFGRPASLRASSARAAPGPRDARPARQDDAAWAAGSTAPRNASGTGPKPPARIWIAWPHAPLGGLERIGI